MSSIFQGRVSGGSGGAAAGRKGAGAASGRVRRLHLVFEGEVQGVGFRWTANRCANDVGCTGWVRNEPDGHTVTMELQGGQEQISSFFGAFTRWYSRYPISYVISEKEDVEPIEDEAGFQVRFR